MAAAKSRAGNRIITTPYAGHSGFLTMSDNRRMGETKPGACQSDSEHYREMAAKLRELARQFRYPGARQELLRLALRYERRADQLDTRSAPAVSDQERD